MHLISLLFSSLFFSPPLFFISFLIFSSSCHFLSYLMFSVSVCPSPSLYFPLFSLSFVLADHHWHQSDAPLHLQPGPRAYGPGREAGRLLSREGGVWGGETWRRTQAQGQESSRFTAFSDQIHRRRHGWAAHSGHLYATIHISAF